MTERIQILMRHEGLSPADFADTVGISRASLSHILTGRNKASLEIVKKIRNHYSRLNYNWLIDGTGDMFVDGNGNKNTPETPPKTSNLFAENPSFQNNPTVAHVQRKENEQPKPHVNPTQGQDQNRGAEIANVTIPATSPAAGPQVMPREAASSRVMPREAASPEIRFVEKPERHIREICIYYDNGTYELFKPA